MDSGTTLYQIRTLGEHRISTAVSECDLSSLGLAAVVYLALARRTPSRAELCELLWERDGSDERHRLRQLLYTIRRRAPSLLVEGRLAISSDQVSLDAEECMSALRRGDALEAVSLYNGHFLETFPTISRTFLDWQDATAARLLHTMRRVVRARLNVQGVCASEVVALAAWLVEYDELLVPERLLLVESLTTLERPQEAQVELQHLEAVPLTRDDQLTIDELVERIRHTSKSTGGAVSIILPETTRRDIAARISPKQHPITMLVGEPGVGKSRVLDWITRLAAVRGARVYTYSIMTPTPVSDLAGVHRLIKAIGAPEVPIAQGRSDHIASLAGRTADFIGDQWTIFAVDNFNHADNATREFFRLLPAMSKSQAVMTVCATTGDGSTPEWSWIAALFPNVDVIRVGTLDDRFSAALLDRVATANGYLLTESQRSVILEQGRGVPRRIIRMADAIADGSSSTGSTWEFDGRLAQTVISQIEYLREVELNVLGCLVLSLVSLSLPSVATILTLSDAEIGLAVRTLCAQSLAMVSDGRLSVVEPHVSKAYLAVAGSTSQQNLRLALAAFHLRNGEYLLAAECYDLARDRQAAGVHYEMAASRALASGSFENVEKACKSALVRSATAEEYQSRSRLLASYYCRVNRWEDAHPHLLSLNHRTPEEELARITSSYTYLDANSDEEWVEIAARLTEMHASRVDQAAIARAYLIAVDRAYQYGKEAIILPAFNLFVSDRTASNPRGLAEVVMKSARINQLFGNPEVALSEAAQAVELALALNDPVVLSNAFDTRALVRFLKGEVDGAFADFEESERVAERAALYFLRERYYNNLAVLNYEIGELAEARRLLRVATLFNPHVQLYALANLAVIEIAAANFDLARNYGLQLRSTPSVTYSIIGLTFCGIADIATGNTTSAQQIFWDLYRRTNAFQLQLTDPSYTLAFAADCGPSVGVDPMPNIERAVSKVADRNVFSFLRLRLALARGLIATDPAQARAICHATLYRSKQAKAIATHTEAEALLASL